MDIILIALATIIFLMISNVAVEKWATRTTYGPVRAQGEYRGKHYVIRSKDKQVPHSLHIRENWQKERLLRLSPTPFTVKEVHNEIDLELRFRERNDPRIDVYEGWHDDWKE